MTFILSSKLQGELLCQHMAFSPEDVVLVLPVCTMPKYVCDRDGWETYFGTDGILTGKITAALSHAGLPPERVRFYDYLSGNDVTLSDYTCLVIPGGDAELGMARLCDAKLDEQLAAYNGTIIAYSAGALILLKKFFLSPNYYYKTFQIREGVGLLPSSFALEVHYDFTDEMKSYIHRAVEELQRTVIALGNDGAVKYDPSDGSLQAVGAVVSFFEKDRRSPVK